jgi:hypothetical protein
MEQRDGEKEERKLGRMKQRKDGRKRQIITEGKGKKDVQDSVIHVSNFSPLPPVRHMIRTYVCTPVLTELQPETMAKGRKGIANVCF